MQCELDIFIIAENALTLAEWLSVTIPHTQSLISMRLSMFANFLGQPLSVKCEFWNALSKKIYRLFWLSYDRRNNSLVQISLLAYSYIFSWLILYIFLQIHFFYHQNTVTRKEAFYKVFLTPLTHQHHLVEFYLRMKKMALGIFQLITCAFGMTYNANVRYIKPLMLNMVVYLAVYKIFFKFIQEFICSLLWQHFVYF